MKPIALAVPVLLGLTASAVAETPYDVLAKPNASWTYDALSPKKHKPTGTKLTLSVSDVKTVGKYTVVVLATKLAPEGDNDLNLSWIIIGPEGVRGSQFTLKEADEGKGTDWSEETIAGQYKNVYLPLVWFPAKLAKTSKTLKLDRFGEDDRVYKVTASLAKAKGKDATGWHLAWKGTYTVPEDPSGSKEKYAASLDFDPAVGFTQICAEGDHCFKLAQ